LGEDLAFPGGVEGDGSNSHYNIIYQLCNICPKLSKLGKENKKCIRLLRGQKEQKDQDLGTNGS